jgi:hypothetical protein
MTVVGALFTYRATIMEKEKIAVALDQIVALGATEAGKKHCVRFKRQDPVLQLPTIQSARYHHRIGVLNHRQWVDCSPGIVDLRTLRL